jgi:anaerobic magnesium-protoporphyrin IX monomethyl ester cyclase
LRIFFVKPGGRDWISYPTQYAVLSSYLKKEGHYVEFYDASLGIETPEIAFKNVDLSRTQVMGISVYTASQNWARTFISLAREKYPEIKIVVGGPHVSALEIPAVEHLGADFGIVGEGELPFSELLKRFENRRSYDDIPGLIWNSKEGWKNTLSLPLWRIKDLDCTPMPDYEMIPPTKYFDVFRGASVARRRERCASMFTSRGCPYMCTYCATNCTWQRRVTALSASRVVQEMALLKDKYGIQEIWFADDTFTFSRKRTMDICSELVERKLNLFWRLPNGIRLESIDDELASWMNRSGCYMTGVGVETGSESAMKLIKKHLNLKIVGEKLRILKKNHILVSGFFIYGFPWETPEQIEETRKFILSNPFDRMQVLIFNPYPGSEEFDVIMNKKDIKAYAENVRKYLYDEKIEPFLQYLDIETLRKKSRDTFFKFYLQPRVLWSILGSLTWQQIRDILRHPIVMRMFGKKESGLDNYIKLDT